MGAGQSNQRGEPAPAKTCYYELLSVERTATEDEIKKAYRRKALELHPDRNLDDVVNANRKFAEVQTAYEILSDPQERAWYDSHRDAILRGTDATGGGTDDDGEAFFYNMPLTTADDLFKLVGRFNSSVAFNDSPTGFFGVLEATFAQLAREEEAACAWDGREMPAEGTFPPFGGSGDSYEDIAKPFYRSWSNFVTKKSFSWCDKYDQPHKYDRYTRREMEKENKKAREQGIREFNDAVRSLVAFVRKRDPRYLPNTQTEADRQKILRDNATAQAARQRAANQERLQERLAAEYVEPSWASGDDTTGQPGVKDQNEGSFSDSEGEYEVHEIECVVCDKSFKSEKQFEAHEKSKKHIKTLHQMKRQLAKENKLMGLNNKSQPKAWEVIGDEEDEQEEEKGADEEEAEAAETETDEAIETKQTKSGRETVSESGSPEKEEANGGNKPKKTEVDGEEEEEDDDDDDYAPRRIVEERLFGKTQDDTEVDGDLAAGVDNLDIGKANSASAASTKKVGKAKAKREKKAAKQAVDAVEGETNTCKICNETFSSNTKLHKHLRVEHPMPTTKAGGKKRKG